MSHFKVELDAKKLEDDEKGIFAKASSSGPKMYGRQKEHRRKGEK